MKLETFFKHFDLLAEAPNGVQKLRELILDLAVRGKLVPQDANDEPAAVLLERIKKEKERLVKEGKIKKARTTIKINNTEIPYKIPKNWIWVRLADVGHDWGQKKPDIEFTYIDVSAINKEKGIISNDVNILQPNEAPSRARKIVYKGTVIYSTIRPYLLNIAIIDKEFKPEPIVSTAFAVIHPFSIIIAQYLYFYLRSNPFIEYVESQMKGMAYPAINDGQLYQGLVPLPPLEEQKRIVTKVDELMKLCDELEARQKKKRETRILINNAALNKLLTADTPETFTKNWQCIGDNFDILYSAPENIGKLRQAILQLAVMGKLVPQDANDEPAAVLLERIKKEKERLVKEGKVKKEKSLPAIKDDEIPYDLPIGWEWVRLGELAKVIEYGTSEKSSELRDDVPVFRMNNVQEGKIIFENLKYVSATIKDLPRLYLQHGDLLFNRTNSYELVGKTGVFKGISNQYTFASYLIKISLMLEYISPDFINTAINSAYFRQTQINPEITQQCGQANFNGTKLKNTLIPLSPLNEQKRIVTKVDKLMKLCDELETKLTQTQTESEKIINAAVKQLLTV
jgi:type I restriction enzyme, S subunit